MNEKIKKLAVHVGAEFNIGFAGSPTFVHFAEDDLQKFAELIVRECACTAAMFSIENKRIHPDIDSRDLTEVSRVVYHATCQAVALNIKELFGVKQ